MTCILLTGGTGFIGRHCVPILLEKGYEVHAVTSKLLPHDPNGVYWHKADLLEPRQVSDLVASVRPAYLLHLAWYAIPGKYWTSVENIRWVQASLNLLLDFASHGGQRVVMTGTCAEYDLRYGYCSEQTTPLAPTTLYGVCKHSLQVMLDSVAEQTGLSAAWARIFFLYGPYEHSKRLVPSVIRSLLKGEPARCSHGNQIRDFLYVEDAAEALVALLESKVLGPVNVASGYPIALKDVVSKIAEKMARKDLIELGVLPVSPGEPRLLVADIGRLTDEVGWQPQYDLDNGLDQTIAWWKGHPDEDDESTH